MSQQTVARWETGRTPPSRYLRELRQLLELPVADLLEQPSREEPTQLPRLELSQAGAVPFGTVRIDLMPLPEEEWLSASERAAATEPGHRMSTRSARRHSESLAAQLARRDRRLSWLWFASLDNRVVLANLHLLEAVALISNSIEDMPAHQPAQIYEAILTPEMQLLLAADPAAQAATAVSDELVSACRSYVAGAGGLEAAISREARS